CARYELNDGAYYYFDYW
nr:immunoglobulin heavy chain junction region [Macaca mulatta]MOW48611.1 immunoglobulin heavy chain junction region [Macaca mulatta]MOW49423.1 immunoglobulin heavy chain junction region [Macaca mulatta]